MLLTHSFDKRSWKWKERVFNFSHNTYSWVKFSGAKAIPWKIKCWKFVIWMKRNQTFLCVSNCFYVCSKCDLRTKAHFSARLACFFFKLVILNHCELHLILFSFDCYRRLDFVRFVMLDEIIKFHLDRIGCQQTLWTKHMWSMNFWCSPIKYNMAQL